MYTLEWEWIGEGYSGDYNRDVVLNDARLMRFTLLYDGEPVNDCSYCTLVRQEFITEEELDKSVPILVELITDSPNMKRKCEELSWLTDAEVKRLVYL